MERIVSRRGRGRAGQKDEIRKGGEDLWGGVK